MAYVRRNVWEFGGDWADPILWYARGVKAMKARALNEPTAWRFYGAMHGMDPGLWRQLGYLATGDPTPGAGVSKTFWNQCQHGSWYFLPWHRGYLIAFESIIRDAVTQLDPSVDWALPYWNYFKPGQDKLPPAFASPDWPDGKGDNPLYVAARYGPNNDGNIYVPLDQVNLDALRDPDFAGAARGGGPGFGGVDTGFSHGGTVHGGVETQPHDQVHGLVGGGDPNSGLPGLMSDPDTAGLDPIFWLHHANIDRLWAVWGQNPPTNVDPSNANWLKGPASIGERAFTMPMPGGKVWTYAPADMGDLSTLGYQYDDVSPPAGAPQLRTRLQALNVGPAATMAIEENVAMGAPKNVELLGASSQPVALVGAGSARVPVALDAAVQRKVSASLTAAREAAVPDRVFLNLENVRGQSDATRFKVYVGAQAGQGAAAPPERLAGAIALFGVRKATQADGEHAGAGLTFVLEITAIVDELHLADVLSTGRLDVRLEPMNPVPEAAKVSIGRISVFRQGA